MQFNHKNQLKKVAYLKRMGGVDSSPHFDFFSLSALCKHYITDRVLIWGQNIFFSRFLGLSGGEIHRKFTELSHFKNILPTHSCRPIIL
jgi:hypothetical protein